MKHVSYEIKPANITWIRCVRIKTDRLLTAGSSKMRGILTSLKDCSSTLKKES